jgi:hypothetical protein
LARAAACYLLAPKIKEKMYFGIAANDDMKQPDQKIKLRVNAERAWAKLVALYKTRLA